MNKNRYFAFMLILSSSLLFSMNQKKKIRAAIGISGNGTNMVNIVEKWKAGYFGESLDIPVVFSSAEDAPGVEKAKGLGIENVLVTPFGKKVTRDQDCARLKEELKTRNIDLVILAGFMYLVNSDFVKAYPRKILNVHPSLLPAYKGTNAIEKAFKAGEDMMGASVIIVADDIDTKDGDTGTIVLQGQFEVVEGDTLEKVTERMHEVEHDIFPRAIKSYCEKLQNNE
jgi:phosphoribosylglycinamide formyltransferase-1